MDNLNTFAVVLKKEVITSIENEKPKVFILGPGLKDKKDGAKLRRELIKRCNTLGLSVTAEHPALDDAGKDYNLTFWELQIADKSDLLIIIPDSPGSFAELGLFCTKKDLCHKLLILFDKRYKNSRSFIQRGPKKSARQRKATVHFIDYSNYDSVWEKVSSFIGDIKEIMAGSRLN